MCCTNKMVAKGVEKIAFIPVEFQRTVRAAIEIRMHLAMETNGESGNHFTTPQYFEAYTAPALYEFREAHGLSHHPRAVVYTLHGGLSMDLPVFNTPGMDVIVVGPAVAAVTLSARGKGVRFVVEPVLEPAGLRRAHERLFAEFGVRYLGCEGGETTLRALHAAKVLDEVFVTVTDVAIDESKHEHVVKIFDFEREGATLIAEGKTSGPSDWHFRHWRFNAS